MCTVSSGGVVHSGIEQVFAITFHSFEAEGCKATVRRVDNWEREYSEGEKREGRGRGRWMLEDVRVEWVVVGRG